MKSELPEAPDACQVLCCEGIKILRFLVTRSPLYMYGRNSASEYIACDGDECCCVSLAYAQLDALIPVQVWADILLHGS